MLRTVLVLPLCLCSVLAACTATTNKAGTTTANAVDPATCLAETGSHLAPAPGSCVNANGTVYSRADLERSGAVTVGDALSKSDPRLTVTQH